ncbi:MAG: choice-of-anchor V domain-containing protein [Bacteroidia bacterium]
MLRKLTLSSLSLIVVVLLSSTMMSDNGRAGKTGSPGEATCIDCHGDYSANMAGGSIAISGITGGSYTPGTTYNLSITVARSGMTVFGLGCEALTSSNTNAGTLVITNSAETQLKSATVSGVSRQSVVHQLDGGATNNTHTFNFNWTAPAAGTGNVTLYYAGIAGDHDGNESGDYVYNGSLALTEGGGCNAPAQPGAISGTMSVCAGSAHTYSVTAVSGATSYVWTLPSGWSGSSTTNSITATANGGSGTISVAASNACGTSNAQTAQVIVNPVTTPTITAGGPTSFCQGGSVTLTSSSGASYLWSPGGATTQSITATNAGSYTVTVTSAGGCTATSTATVVTVITPTTPTISAGGPTSFCQGGSVTLTSSAGTSYLWSPGGATTQSITATNAGSYTVTVTSAGGCSATSAATVVTVTTPTTPTISANGPTSFCQGGSVMLTSSAGSSYLWSPGGATTQSITVTNSGSYTVTVTSGSCTATSVATVVTVSNTSTPTITASGPTSFCQGGSVDLTASAGTSYLWSPGGATTQTITVTNSGSYTVTVTSGTCTGTSAATVVTVSNTSTPIITASGPTAICLGGSVDLTASTGGSYLWSPGGETTQTITVTAAGSYEVTVTTGTCTGTSAATVVTVSSGSTPTITANGPTTFCQGGSVDLTASAGSSYLWSPGGETTQTITVTAGGSYEVTVTSAGGCSGTSAATAVTVTTTGTPTISASGSTTICDGSSVTLTSSSGTDYLWSPGGETTQSITVSAAGSYEVTVTGGCAGTSLPTVVTVNPNPTPSVVAGGNTTFCQGGNVVLTASAASSYAWAPGGETTQSITVDANGTYAVTVTDANGCSGTDAGTLVTVNPLPVVSLAAFSPVCDTIAAFALSGGSPAGGTYSGTGVSGGNFDPAVSGAGTFQITYSYTNTDGCTAEATASLTVNVCTGGGCTTAPDAPQHIAGPSRIYCNQTGIVYSINAVATATSYDWTVPTGLTITSNTGTSITVDEDTSFHGGLICVSAVNACGSSPQECKFVRPGRILISPIHGPHQVCVEDSSVDYAISPVTGAVSYVWTIGGGASLTSNGTTATVDFSTATMPFILLRVAVTDGCGTVRYRSIWIHVSEHCDGDGHHGGDGDDDDGDDDGDDHGHEHGDRIAAGTFDYVVYPNPSSGIFQVELDMTNTMDVNINVLDLYGKHVAERTIHMEAGRNTVSFDIPSLAPGVYFLSIHVPGEQAKTQRIMITR